MKGMPFPGAKPPYKKGGGRATDDTTSSGRPKLDVASRRKLAHSGAAMPDGSFPITNVTSLRDAIHAVGRAKNPAAAKAHIVRRARALGAVSHLPPAWAKGGK